MQRSPTREALIPILILCGLIAAAPPPAAADNFLDRARSAVREADRTIEQAARNAGRSVRDFLTDHPELNRDLVDLGERAGIPGFAGAAPEPGPGVMLSVGQGQPGSEVSVSAAGLPGDSDTVVSIGAIPTDTPVLAHARTSDRGEMIATVKVPADAKVGSHLMFTVETADGRVRLVSEPFLIASSAAAVSVTGTISKEGAECPTMRGDDGRLYSLTPPGNLGSFGPGDRVHVEGTLAEVSTCMQGTTVVVSGISAAN